MSYFDHVQCHSCGARMDPEKLVPGPGEMPACPYCGQSLNLADLFGVKDAFVGHDDGEGNDHSLDDLVGGELYDSRYPGGRRPEPGQGGGGRGGGASAPRSGGASRAAPEPGLSAADLLGAGKRRSAPKALPGPTAQTRNALVPTGRSDDDDTPPPPRRRSAGPSAADLLNEMKKKR